MANAKYTDGSNFSVKAGDGVFVSVGASVKIYDKTDLQLTVGYQETTTNATNGSVKFARTLAEFLGFYDLNGKWRLGAGLRTLSGVKLSGSGAGASQVNDTDYNASLGAVLETQYFFGSTTNRDKAQYGISLRAISQSIETKESKQKSDASSLGLGFFVYF